MDRHVILAHKNGVALLEDENQYIVVTGYNPNGAENQQWDSGKYFSHWRVEEKKAEYLMKALDLYRAKTEEGYIANSRMADDKESVREYFTETCEMDEQGKKIDKNTFRYLLGLEEPEEKRVVSWPGRGGR